MIKNEMNAIKLTNPINVELLNPSLVPMPKLIPGHVLIEVKAFGVNESEVTSRKGGSDADFSFPRILGIEGVGIIAEINSDSKFEVGQKVATMMNGLGRAIDGSYAEYMLVPEKNLILIHSDLSWDVIGALPETLQTAYGSLQKGLSLKKGETLLIRGGTSTVGLMAALLAKSMGVTVISTTRNPNKITDLQKVGVDYPLLDDNELEKNILKINKDGVDKALELVGTTALMQTLHVTKVTGKVCFTGALSNEYSIKEFTPFMIPTGVSLTSYAGDVHDLPEAILNDILQKISNGQLTVPIAKVYHGLESVKEAQQNIEASKLIGKHVVVL